MIKVEGISARLISMAECAICLEKLCLPCALPCNHAFDAHCLMRVLILAASKGEVNAPCPCCRQPFVRHDLLDRAAGGLEANDPPASQEAFEGAVLEYERLAAEHARLASGQASDPRPHSQVAVVIALVAAVIGMCSMSPLLFTLLQALGGVPSVPAPPTTPARLNEATQAVSLRRCEAWRHRTSHSASATARQKGAWLRGELQMGEGMGEALGWLVGGWPGSLLGAQLGNWFVSMELSATPQADATPQGCASEWMRLAVASLAAQRPLHATAHTRSALAAADDALRPQVLMLLHQCIEAAHGPTTESEAALRQAARAGHVAAQKALALRLEDSDPVEAAAWLERVAPVAVDEGESWRRLGVLRLTGRVSAAASPDNLPNMAASPENLPNMAAPSNTPNPDYRGAASAFEAAALSGDADGAYNLGRMIEWRQVRASDVASAVSVAGGDGDGRTGAGGPPLARDHRGMTRDHREAAAFWYEVAAERGLVLGRAHLARVLTDLGDATACKHYTAAAQAGDADSQWALSSMMRRGDCLAGAGQGVRSEALRWAVAAAERRQPEALAWLEETDLSQL